MEAFVQWLAKVNDAVNAIVWGWPMMILILGAGIYLTVRTKVLQVRKFGTSWGETIIPVAKSLGKKQVNLSSKERTISPFEAFATAISGTVGTGNIVGVTSAIMGGGPGAVFWMWVSAFFGMVTNYAENVLGMYFRKKDSEGEFVGGPMQYLSEGIGNDKNSWGKVLKTFGKVLAVMACVFCLGAAIGMSGVQASKISDVATTTITAIDPMITAIIVGVIVAVILGLILLGGIKSIGRVTAILVPFMSLIFIVMSLVIIFTNVTAVGGVFVAIFSNIFGFKAAVAGFGGYVFSQIIKKGLARGIFSNEAGLGSSVIAHSASATREPVKQGLWGIFEVFFDTFIICTLTALVVLVTIPNETLYSTNAVDTAVSMSAFATFIPSVKAIGTVIYSITMPLFAFTTILAWSYYGERCVQYLFTKTGVKGQKIATTTFKVLYVVLVIVFVVLNELQKSIPELPNALIWGISDTFNGLMALPNLIGLIIMGGLVAKITKNYFDRKKGKNVEPMLSAYPEQNAEFIADLATEQANASVASEPVAEVVAEPAQEPAKEEVAVSDDAE